MKERKEICCCHHHRLSDCGGCAPTLEGHHFKNGKCKKVKDE